jgi:class 3 adenylate cyclase
MAIAPVRSLQTLLIGTFDLKGFTRAIRGLDSARVADIVDALYLTLGEGVTRSGGRIVKYLGDGALAVWPPEAADSALEAMLELRNSVAAAIGKHGMKSELVVRLHCGDAVAGEFGPDRQYDVFGGEVLVAFNLPVSTASVSAEAFRRLSPAMRARLQKHTEPVVYIPIGDPRP